MSTESIVLFSIFVLVLLGIAIYADRHRDDGDKNKKTLCNESFDLEHDPVKNPNEPESTGDMKAEETEQDDKSGQLKEFFEQLRAIPWGSFWSLSLAIGGLLLLSFFSSIEYLPDLDINSIASTVAGVAVVGVFIVLIIGFGLTLPTLFTDANDVSKENKKHLLWQAVAGVFLAFCALVYVAFFREYGWGWLVLLSILLAASLWLSCRSKSVLSLSSFVLNLFKELAWAAWTLVVPMFYYKALAVEKEDIWLELFFLFLIPLSFAFLSLALAFIPKDKRTAWRFAAAIGAVFFLAFVTHRPAFVSQASVAVLGLSIERQPVTLVLTEAGCNSINLLFNLRPCSFDKTMKLGSLSHVKVMSRIGGQYVIHWRPEQNAKGAQGTKESATDDDNWRRAILRKEDVLSLAYDLPTSKKTTK
jgi:MFS family permease